MKRTGWKRAVLVVSACAVLALSGLSGCLPSAEDALVGTWKQVDGTEVLQFLASGEIIQEDSGGSIGANYRFIDDLHIRVDFGGPAIYAPPRTYRVAFVDDALELTDEADATKTYRRTERVPTVDTELE